MIPLAVFEEIIDASGVAPQIEALLPIGVRHRQLRVRTLLAGMMLSQADHRPAHLTRVRDALIALPGPDQVRLGVLEDWETGPHLLTYRQTERTFGLVASALDEDRPRRAALRPAAAPLRRPARGIHPGRIQGRQPVAGRGLDRPGVLLPATAGQGRPLRRPRGLLGTPQEQPAAQPRRAVLRLLPVRRDHDARRARPRRPRVRPPRHRVIVPPRPGPRARPGPDRDARGRDPARRHARRLWLRLPRRRRLGDPAPPGRGPARPGPAPARPRPERHPPRRRHQQRQPVLPANTAAAAGTGAAGPRRDPGASRRARRPDRRAGPLQARQHHPRRP